MSGHASAYRRLFRAAAVYNFAFAAWSVLVPQHWFRLIGAPEDARSEGLWQCIGMILGLYGILYWHVANHPATGRLIAVVGLLGKVLGPIGWAWNFARGTLPAASFVVIAGNDLVWWPGFAAFLRKDAGPRRNFRLLVLIMLATTHAVGALLLLMVQQPERFGLDATSRATLWTFAWALWCIADVFSPAFVYATLQRHAPGSRTRHLLLVLIVLAAAGDFVLNAYYAAFAAPAAPGTGPIAEPSLRLLSLTVTNGLFLAAYLVLTAALWRRVPRWLTLHGMPAWAGAFGLCLEGAGIVAGVSLVSGILLVSFYCCWLLGLLGVDSH